jgi:glycosyltransferase involved in cell wall biosynthesis
MGVYNSEKYLAEAIESILTQSFSDFEFIIVNDGSTDNSFSICDRYANADDRVQIISNTTNIGLTKSLNIAIRLSRGRYIARMDGDDISLPQRLQKQIEYMDNFPEIGILGTYYAEVGPDSVIIAKKVSFPIEPIILNWRLLFENPIPHPTILVKREVYETVKGYDPTWKYSQDYDLFTRASLFTKLANYPEILLLRRPHENSISKSNNKEQRELALHICKNFISQIIHTDLEEELIKDIWDRQFSNIKTIGLLTEILIKTYRQISSNNIWTQEEKKLLDEYVAGKMYEYLKPNMSNLHILPHLAKVITTFPEYFRKKIWTFI